MRHCIPPVFFTLSLTLQTLVFVTVVVGTTSTFANAQAGPTQVRLGAGFGCGLSEAGDVRCWGRCGDGQCGSDGGDATIPRAVPGLDQVTQVDVGYSFACALREDHTVWCWGDNGYLQLGEDAIEERTTPAQVRGLADIEEIALGAFHACARRDDGVVLCWGSNSQGVLTRSETPEKRAEPRPIRGVRRASALWSGHYHSCARSQGGRLRCWGGSAHGQSGTRRRVRRAGATVVRDAGDPDVVSLADGHGCLIEDAVLKCWGHNLYGAGDPATGFYSTPQPITQLEQVDAVSARSENQCAVSAGRVYCWGVNRQHQLNVPTDEAGMVVIHPSPVPNLTSITEVAVGWSTQCARHEDGHWSCWGINRSGAVGVGSRERMVSAPTRLPWE